MAVEDGAGKRGGASAGGLPLLMTFTTDFGTSGSYVGAMRGAALSAAPGVRLVDITHEIPPQNVVEGARVLASACPWYPPGTVHCVVVDPGVGTERAAVIVRAGEHLFVAPDNGILGPVIERLGLRAAYRVDEAPFEPLSATFHGRDLFAPVAARLASGAAVDAFGPPVAQLVSLVTRPPERQETASGVTLTGEVEAVDHFGNLLTNIAVADLPETARVRVAGQEVPMRVRSYGDAPASAPLVWLGSSDGRLEIATPNGNAARALECGTGTQVEVRW